MDAKRIARAGVMVALLAVSAQVMVPIGPVPVTLQTLVLAIMIAVLDARTALFSVVAYVVLGAIGMPVFAGFMGGLGALMGPTGGFLWGFILGTAVAGVVKKACAGHVGAYAECLVAASALLLVSYACGTAQLMMLMSLDFLGALGIAVIPFIVPDALKMAIGARIGLTVARALK